MRFLEDGGTRCGACLKLKVRVDLLEWSLQIMHMSTLIVCELVVPDIVRLAHTRVSILSTEQSNQSELRLLIHGVSISRTNPPSAEADQVRELETLIQ
jgi:hypothetical protein